MANSKPNMVVVIGPTAIGKTQLAIYIAEQFSGEIINTDSRQVYRYMDIGTAKPSISDRTRVPHHMIDINLPDTDFSLGEFIKLANVSIEQITERGNLPIICGGTGQYVWGIVEGWAVPNIPPNQEFRTNKLKEAEEHGINYLHNQLSIIDPKRASEIDPRNVRRVIRALEIIKETGLKPSQLSKLRKEEYNPIIIGLTTNRRTLYHMIDVRVDHMIKNGFLDEVKCLATQGYKMGIGSLASPGYRELGQYLEGEYSLEEAISKTKFQTHRLARRQYTWFKQEDPRITWLDVNQVDITSVASTLVTNYLS